MAMPLLSQVGLLQGTALNELIRVSQKSIYYDLERLPRCDFWIVLTYHLTGRIKSLPSFSNFQLESIDIVFLKSKKKNKFKIMIDIENKKNISFQCGDHCRNSCTLHMEFPI
jgi:hypothetical protein